MDVRPSRQLHFPPFRLDPDNACVWRGKKAVRLTPKAFAVLQCLAERHGQLVTKDFLLESVWPGTVVGDAVLKVCVREIRQASPQSRMHAFISMRGELRVIGNDQDRMLFNQCMRQAGYPPPEK